MVDKVSDASAVVIGGDYAGHTPSRQEILWSAAQAVRASEKSGVQPPPPRQSRLYREARELVASRQAVPYVGGDLMQASELWSHKWDHELVQLKADFEGQTGSAGDGEELDIAKRRLSTLTKHKAKSTRSKALVLELINMDLEIHRLELAAKHGPTATEREEARSKWDALRTQLETKLQEASAANEVRVRLMGFSDGFRAAYQEPTLLQWDRRPYEPLMADANEFWPQVPLTLIDFRPKPQSKLHHAKVWDGINKAIFRAQTSRLAETLAVLAPGADEALLSAAPLLSDPAKGGRLDPLDVRARMTTAEMIDQLVQAYIDWAFRPDEETAAFYRGVADPDL